MTDLDQTAAASTRMPSTPIPPWTPPELPPRRSRRRPLVAVGVVLVLLSGLAIGLWLQGRNPEANPAAQTRTQTQSPPLSQPQLQPPDSAAIALPPLEPPTGLVGVPPPGQAPAAAPAPPAAAAAPAQPPAAAPAPVPPSVEWQLVNPNPIRKAGCSGDRASVIAKISSDGEPRAVALFSRGPDGVAKVVPMVKVGGGWMATLGPYGVLGNVTWVIGVTDAHGVTANGPTSTLPVVTC